MGRVGVWACGRGHGEQGGRGGGWGGRRRVSRVPVPGNRAPWGRLNPGRTRTKGATGGLGGGSGKEMPKFTGDGCPAIRTPEDKPAVDGGRWSLDGGRDLPRVTEGGSSSAQPQPWALTPPRFSKIARVHWCRRPPKRMDKHGTVPVALTRLALRFRELRCRPWS